MSRLPQSVRSSAFPWLSGPRATGWLLGARVAFVLLLGAGLVLGGVNAIPILLPMLVLFCVALGRMAARQVAGGPVRIWLTGLLCAPWLVFGLGNASLGYRLGLVIQGQANLASLFAGDVLAVLLLWPVIVLAATRPQAD